MAYEIKYRITAATKSDVTSVLNIYEDGYDGEIIEYPCISLQLQYIPRSDDAFEPIYVSQLSVAIDVTDNVEDMPDFTTLNDKVIQIFGHTKIQSIREFSEVTENRYFLIDTLAKSCEYLVLEDGQINIQI